MPTKRQTLIADALRQFPDAGHRTLAKRLHDKHPLLFKSVENARGALRTYTGNSGKDRPNDKKRSRAIARGTTRPPRKPGELPPLPKSEAKPWEPFVLECKRCLVLSDLHLPYHSEIALEGALAFGDSFGPDAILINGDLFDFHVLSRFDKDPSKPKLLGELECGRQLFAHLRTRFPKAPITYKFGNHCERWDKYLWQAAPFLFEIEEVQNAWYKAAGIDEHGVQVVKDQRPIMLGKLPVLHGHELGQSAISSPVNPARGAFLRAHHTILVGHSHQTSGHSDPNMWHDETFCWSTGCLCQLTPEWRRINRWNWGAATVEVSSDGSFEVVNFRVSKDGKARKS